MQNQNTLWFVISTEVDVLNISYHMVINCKIDNFQKKIFNKRNLKLTIETLEEDVKYVQS